MTTRLAKITKQPNTPKYELVIRSITQAIENKKIRRGDSLPSLNQIKKNFGVSLNTAVKAYDYLKEKGLIDSVNGKGFHVVTENVKRTINLFLLFDELNLFKEDLYNSIKDTLGSNANIDIYFHHYNFNVYESLILENLNRYNFYAIMPHPDPKAERVLKQLNPEQVLILDQKHHISNQYAYLVQDFRNETYQCLCKGLEQIQKYQQFEFIYPNRHKELDPFSREIILGTEKFCIDYSIPFTVIKNLTPKVVQKGSVYFVLPDDELVTIIKYIRDAKYKLGKDIGLISFNDNQLKEVIEDGITVISTDFSRMGRIAAISILEKRRIQEINASAIILRGSL